MERVWPVSLLRLPLPLSEADEDEEDEVEDEEVDEELALSFFLFWSRCFCRAKRNEMVASLMTSYV